MLKVDTLSGFLIVLILISFQNVLAVNYYISAAGDDENNGTSKSTPWQTLNRVNSSAFSAGDKILFRGGDTFSGNLYFDVSGTEANPITVSSYGTGRATLAAGVGAYGISVYNAGGYKITDLILKGAGISPDINVSQNGVQFFTDLPGQRTGIHLSNLDISNFSGIRVRDGSDWRADGGIGILIAGVRTDNQLSGYDDIKVINCQSHQNNSNGMFTWTHKLYGITNIYVAHSVFHSNPGILNLTKHSGSGLALGGVDGAIVEHCIAYQNGANNSPSEGPVGIWTWDSNNVTIQFCESYDNRTQGGDGGGFDLDGGVTNSVIQYCYSHDNYGAGFLLACYSNAPQFSNNIVRYNISENDGRKGSYGGITFYGAGSEDKIETTHVYNNTIWVGSKASHPKISGTPSCLRFQGGQFSGNAIRNNIFISADDYYIINADTNIGPEIVTLQRNAYWASEDYRVRWAGHDYQNHSDFLSAASKQEWHDSMRTALHVDPQVVAPGQGGTLENTAQPWRLNAYKLESSSPMIDTALDINTLFGQFPGARDFWGNSLPWSKSFDIGAHEKN